MSAPMRRYRSYGPIILVAIVLVVVATLVTMALAMGKTDRNEIGIVYGGGPFEGRHFQQVLQPGSPLTFLGWFDPMYTYPVTQRSYIISKTEGDVTGVVTAASKDRVKVDYEVATYFRLNTDQLQSFHEILGLKYLAWTDAGWDQLLQESFKQQIEFALQRESRRWDVADIFANEQALLDIQRNVGISLKSNVEEVLGGEYFCGVDFRPGQTCPNFTFVIKSVLPPPNIVAEYENNRASQIAIQTKINEVLQRQEEAKGIAALNDALEASGPSYVLLKAIEAGGIDFWVIPSDTDLALPASVGSLPSTTTTTTVPEP